MLVELAVENYAVIEAVRVRFQAGLNLLTGETGSGKSIVVDALGLLLGGRASAEMVRAGAARARISGIFEVTPSPALDAILDAAGIETEDGELLIEREILPTGKSRAFAANRPATAALLRDLAPHLADIHGQHDQQQLFSSEIQCAMLDAFAKSDALLHPVADSYARWKQTTAELEELDRTAQEKLRLADLWQFQRKEIEAVEPHSGEDAELENERRVLRNVVRLQQLAGSAFAALSEDPESVVTQIGIIAKRLEELARIDETAKEIQDAIEPARAAIDEAARTLGHYVDRLEADPARLDEVEARLASIEKLKRKYGASIPEIAAFLEETVRELAAVENTSDRRAALEKESAKLTKSYETAAHEL
ncbi:MAG: AAA family ATPase, partial [Acidobacteriota bacterium]